VVDFLTLTVKIVGGHDASEYASALPRSKAQERAFFDGRTTGRLTTTSPFDNPRAGSISFLRTGTRLQNLRKIYVEVSAKTRLTTAS
jgi:hypothetical protein